MKEVIGHIYRTDEYSMFKRLDGNRGIKKTRVKKIKNSINSVGYILSPILVNEKNEVIDGQGRLEALEDLGLPVDFIVTEGAGIEECVAMNIHQTNWTMNDYIDSYSERGNVSYMYLRQLINRFGNLFRLNTICNAVTNMAATPNDALKNGNFVCSGLDYDNAVEALVYLTNFKPIIDKVGGRTEYYYSALLFCFHDQQVDNDRLIEKMTKLQASLIPVANVQQAFDQIEAIYNNKTSNKVYVKTNYRQYLDGKYGWYSKKYGDKYENSEH